MLDSIVEYITEAASSYAFIFFFCNLIIVIIIVDLKPKISTNQGSEIPLTMPSNIAMQGSNSKCFVYKNAISPQAVQKFETQTQGNDSCYGEEDDELRRKAEEFIERVTKGWKEEHLSSSSLLCDPNNKELWE